MTLFLVVVPDDQLPWDLGGLSHNIWFNSASQAKRYAVRNGIETYYRVTVPAIKKLTVLSLLNGDWRSFPYDTIQV